MSNLVRIGLIVLVSAHALSARAEGAGVKGLGGPSTCETQAALAALSDEQLFPAYARDGYRIGACGLFQDSAFHGGSARVYANGSLYYLEDLPADIAEGPLTREAKERFREALRTCLCERVAG